MTADYTLIQLPEVDSTNAYLRHYTPADEEVMTVVTAEYQTSGRGQGTNTWHSNAGENLLYSVLTHPHGVAANRQFILSIAIALSVRDALRQHIGDVEIKWPNDIYWHHHKLGGILIECSLKGHQVKDCIMGVGLNVNQKEFPDTLPNPISIYQVTLQSTDRNQLLHNIICHLQAYLQEIAQGHYDAILESYLSSLYYRQGYHIFTDDNGSFMARIINIDPFGHLLLKDDDGMMRRYDFKEVQFVHENVTP